MAGWIKLHRGMTEWEWYHDTNTFRLFIHLLLNANHTDRKWRGIDIKRGQIVTGRKTLSAETGLSQQAVRTCLERLKRTGEITIESTSKYSVLTIEKYSVYQDQEIHPTSGQPAVNQQATSKQPASNHKQEGKEGKEGNNERINKARPKDAASVSGYAKSINFTLDGQKFIDNYEANGWMRGKNKIKDWKACVRTWKTRSNESNQGSTSADDYSHWRKIGADNNIHPGGSEDAQDYIKRVKEAVQ